MADAPMVRFEGRDRDLYVNASELPKGRTTLARGAIVRCGTKEGEEGVEGARVEVLSEPAPSSRPARPRPVRPPTRAPVRPAPSPPEPSEQDLAVARIAEVLGESEPKPLEQLRRIIGRLGLARVEELLAQVDEVEAAGGMPVPDGSRRCTRGGVFFTLARQSIPRRARGGLFVFPVTAPTASLTTPPSAEALGELLADVARWPRGVAGSVKIALVGRPGPLQQTARPGQPAEFFAFPLESGNLPSLPKELPAPTVPTTFLVLVSARQWRRVADALRNAQDRLIIEGHSSIDARVPDMITVRAISVTTVEAQRAKQQAESAQRESGEAAG